MCGIAGVISRQPIDMIHVKKMNDKLIHRGPDSYGYLCSRETINKEAVDRLDQLDHFSNTHLVFAHRRLAILDLSEAGHQPMSYLDKYWLIFNGEIYNFIELRTELEKKGYTFHTQTDTEVVLAAYDFWGEDCLNKFNGDWALALIDKENQTILISRDRFGIKPLYYFSTPGLFLFASEIKAILEHPAVNREPNLHYLYQYIKHGPNEYDRETAFKNIFHFDFASYFSGPIKNLLEPNKINIKRFWSLTPNLSNETLDEKKLASYSEEYYSLLEDAVKIRLRADVKVGANLSGGLDSSSIVYLINSVKQNAAFSIPLETFSSVYQSPGTLDCDESSSINEMIKQLNITSHQTEPRPEDIPQEHRKMIYHMDSPPESTLMSSWYTAKLINQKNTRVTMTGEGADEQLAGYLRYLTYYFSNMRFRHTLSSYKIFKTISGARVYIRVGLMMNAIQKILGKRVTQYLYTKTGRKEKIFTPPNEKLKEDIQSNLLNLHHIDEAVFMAFSIEHRAPFMDHRLVEFLASVPIAYKLAKGRTKYLARKAFDNLLPASINWNKDKLGWPIPERFWLENHLKEWVNKTIKNSEFLKEQRFFAIKNLDKISHTVKIRLLNIAVWHEIFLNSSPT